MSRSKRSRHKPRKKQSNSNSKKLIVIAVALIAVVAVIIVGFSVLGNNSNPDYDNLPETNTVLLQTSMGDIVIQLRDDMPITTNNFKKLVLDGVYDNTIFHRIINLSGNLVIMQGGDPQEQDTATHPFQQ
jgi:flagellar basal body-associated protein FliL